MKNFNELRANLTKDTASFKKIKIAVLADTASQFLVTTLRGMGVEHELDLEIYEADYDQIDAQIIDENSELYHFSPDITLIYESSPKLLEKHQKNPTPHFANSKIEHLKNQIHLLQSRGLSKVFYLNFPLLNDKVFGNFAYKLNFSFPSQVEKLNFLLTEVAQNYPDFYLIDAKNIISELGNKEAYNNSLTINANVDFNLPALVPIADSIVTSIASIYGKFKKCLILDLDNTLWGGIIGDDGIEKIQIGSLGIGKAFSQLQYWAKSLKERGVILAICSKNNEDTAKEPFIHHPDMVLRLEDISVFIANWENKADNIRKIQKTLNIGLDSMVFLDDNPAERSIVKENLPQVCVPELPKDPANYMSYLRTLNLFETASFSENDKNRTQQYQEEYLRLSELEDSTDEESFLQN